MQPCVSTFRCDPSKLKPKESLDLQLNDPSKWAANISGNGKMEVKTIPEGGVSFPIQFVAPGDRWVYPVARFDPPRDFSQWAGIAFEYRCHDNDGSTSVSMQVYEPNGSGYLGSVGVAKKDWTPATCAFEDMTWGSYSPADPNGKLDLDKIATLMIGMNTPKDDVLLEVRNMRLVRF